MPLIALVAAIDWITGREIALSIFYLGPVVLLAFYADAVSVVVASLVGAAAWMWADRAAGTVYSHEAIAFWNGSVRLGFFLLFGLTVLRLRTLQAVERRLARTDALTGLLNRRAFNEAVEHEIARARRSGRPLSLALFDLDGFKQINDRHGHATGDRLLGEVARILRQNLRSVDAVARIGGDEFAAILVDADGEAAPATLQRAGDAVRAQLEMQGWPVTASIGAMTCIDASTTDAEGLLHAIDQLMYEAKSAGGGRLRHVLRGPSPELSTEAGPNGEASEGRKSSVQSG